MNQPVFFWVLIEIQRYVLSYFWILYSSTNGFQVHCSKYLDIDSHWKSGYDYIADIVHLVRFERGDSEIHDLGISENAVPCKLDDDIGFGGAVSLDYASKNIVFASPVEFDAFRFRPGLKGVVRFGRGSGKDYIIELSAESKPI